MRRTLTLVVALIAISFLAGACSPIQKVGSWKLKDMKAAVVFYSFKPGKAVEEEKVKKIATKIANEWREHYSDVRVVILNDANFARTLAKDNDRAAYVTAEGIKLDREILTGASLNPPGGAYLHLSDKSPQIDWAFIGKEAVRTK